MPRWVRRAIALFFTWIIGLLAAYWLVTKLHTLLLMVLGAFFLSLAMEPAVNYMVKERGRAARRRRPAS